MNSTLQWTGMDFVQPPNSLYRRMYNDRTYELDISVFQPFTVVSLWLLDDQACYLAATIFQRTYNENDLAQNQRCKQLISQLLYGDNFDTMSIALNANYQSLHSNGPEVQF